MNTLVQQYLLTHSLTQLAEEHGVYARWNGGRTKFSLNYDQIEATDGDPLSQECRGLVLRPLNRGITNDEICGETAILARPMRRFFNLGQEAAAELDFESDSVRIMEKLDGTLCIVYWDSEAGWCVGTRSVCEADLPVDGFGDYTFRTLFIEAFEKCSGLSWTDNIVPALDMGRDRTFCFELLTPYNQVVVRHDTMSVALLAVRHNESGLEDSYERIRDMWCDSEMLGCKAVPQYSLKTLSDITTFVNSRPGLENEGVVGASYDSDETSGGLCTVSRVKIKSAAYLLASRTKSVIGASPRNLMELILLEQIDDLLPVLTDKQKEMTEEMREKLRVLMHDFDRLYHEKMAELKAEAPMSDHNRRKWFARAVGSSGMWMAPAMAMYEGKATTLHEWILRHKERTNDGRFPSGFLDTLCKQVQLHGRELI